MIDPSLHRRGLRRESRRLFLRGTLSIGALSLLTGCNLEDDDAVDRVLSAMSRWNDTVQAALFSRARMAPTYPEADITDPFPFNAYYKLDQVRHVDGAAWRLEVSGLVTERRPWTLADLAALPQASQITRHICIEGWSAIGKWGGVPFRDFLARVGADTRARYVSFRCADDYRGSIDMATALHKQTLLALTFRDAPLPAMYGFPMKLRVPTKLGFKNPKHIIAIEVTNVYPGGFWEDYGYNWFSGS
ncbi:MAG TPA: molybdopterin-dependent oxidoreductase [Acetobacteraceae bacterium]|nr:molybdopterin-dependent oxidoreductase [Acetobacteraceae bacterium]